MVAKLRTFLALSALAICLVALGGGQSAQAATYGGGNYGACNYQSDSCTTNGSNAGAPNTGVHRDSNLGFIIAGILGFSLVSFATIRYINRDRQAA